MPNPSQRAIRLPWPQALAGALAAGVAIAASELLAGLVPGVPSLVTAAGALAIAIQPPGAKDVMVSLFGANDKVALHAIVLGLAAAIAAAAGVLAARRRWVGAAFFVGFGLVAGWSAARQPLAQPGLVAVGAAVAIGSGIAALLALLGLASDRSTLGGVAADSRVLMSSPANVPATGPAWARRRFLIASAGTLGGVVVSGSVGRSLLDRQHAEGVVTSSRLPAPFMPAPAPGAEASLAIPGLTPLVVPSGDFYRIDTALLVPNIDAERWQLTVTGMVDHPLTLTYDELLAMPLYEQHVTISCVSNRVGGHLVGNALWTGVRLKDVLEEAGVQPGATQIVGRSYDDFSAGFPTSWATAPDREPLIAVGMNREPLPAAHGFPARLIVPGLYGYVSATKWLTQIQLTTREAVDGYWVPLGWAKDGPILTQSRIDVPAANEALASGTTDIAGLAWAPDRGVRAVEVRIDDGPWQRAELTQPISKATWVQWRLRWNATSGDHAIEVRATDGTGDVQTTEVTDPAPDGARGHHRIIVTVH